MGLRSAVVTVAILLLVHSNVDALTRPSSIRLENNGYTGIVVAIHNNVPENDELIERIKYMFTEGSKYLYEATRKRAYFDKVTILVPKTWTPKPEYQLPGNVTFDYADVIVAPPNPRWAPLQYTKQYQGCGEQGIHIHFLESFLSDPNTELYYGPLGRMLVHEWGHLRWGLFDEYPDAVGDPDNYQEFYFSPITNQFEGVRCSYDYKAVPLIFFPDNLFYRECNGGPDVGYEDGCVYYVIVNQDDVTSSIMYGTYPLELIANFCDDDETNESNLHNREAPNKHNRLCGRRSNWEVLRDHVDFQGDKNPPRNMTEEELVPEFTIVQHKDIRVVLLMDTSGSMTTDNRFSKMISSSANYISSIVTDGSYIGIVEFNYVGIILKNLTLVTSDDDRQALLESLPPDAAGSTAIGDGLLKSIEVLSYGGRNPAGGIILLISDGDEREAPYIDDVIDDVTRSGVIVDSLAFTQNADSKLFKLSDATGGKSFFYSNEPGSNTLYEAFASTMERGDVRDADKRVQLFGTSWTLVASETREGGIFMDNTLGRKTEFAFSWTTTDQLAIEVTLTDPNGTVINSTYDGYGVDVTFRLLTIKLPGVVQPGAWEFAVRNLDDSDDEEVSITISSYPASDDVEPIIVTSELSGSITAFERGEPLVAYAELRQGFSPIIYANVYATIERPGGYDPVQLQLLDNGAGVDVTKNDGVYSRTFTDFTGVGFYGIKIDVDNNNGNAVVVDTAPFSKARPIISPDKVFDLPTIGGFEIPLPGTPPEEPKGRSAPYFSRGISGGSSRVESEPPGFTPGSDTFPPGTVIDLRVSASSFENATVTLAWTAPGDDLDNGAASRYEIVRATSILAWQNDSTPESHYVISADDIIQGNLSEPQDYGQREVYVIQVPIAENATVASYAFVLRAFDDAGLVSRFSNAVQATLREYVPPSGPSKDPEKEGLTGGQIAMIVCLTVGGVLLIAVLIVVGVKCANSKEKKVDSGKEKKVGETVEEVDGHANNAYTVSP
ncbi:calcium-activated chloride channel regulator 1-like [Patiria miniata]|uniref:VWFA domain-containing protein n=1 Tax=Patiria miniata TaxID=46514 RepID=A0A914ACG4_PATMI|nr:calcium-activated chloride channel regulator 1-like [Patiria miniata]